ncbi:uncharacterized protein LOC128279016 [Anopheles cruzii]|uniref:uncharacterized protein LOC128279016 n=1 Tax=Anopheles cruzii TaxID=68878 RepID=UPI0022EC8601|nr:uncharacterized protein LOC128279016 [Anopheles cruzii]
MFWLAVLLFSVVYSVNLCHTHWERFRDNATVLNVETDYLSWQFRPPAATVCFDHVTEATLAQLVSRYWKVTTNHSHYRYYRQFLLTVNRARYDNLWSFEPFANDSTLEGNVSLIDLVRELHQPWTPPGKSFAPVLTEVGICYSSTALYYLQSPDVEGPPTEYLRARADRCSTLDVCRAMVALSHSDATRNDVYIHIEEDVMTGDSPIHYLLGEHHIVSSVLSVEQIVASKAVKQLSSRRRKCRLPTEGLQYFDNEDG